MSKGGITKEVILKELDRDKFLGNYAAKTRDRIAGTVAVMLRKDPKVDFGKEITGPRGVGVTNGIFNENTVDGIIRQRTAADISIGRLKKMRTDPQVQLGLTAIKAPVIGALTDVPAIEGDDPEVNAFVDTMLEGFWKSLVRSSMNGLDFGFLPHEKIFSKEDFTWGWEVQGAGKKVGKEQTLTQAWVLTKLKDIDPEGVKIWVDKEDESFKGFTEKGKEVVDIVPAPKAFVFTPEREFGNLYGKPRLIPPYEPWTTFTILEYFSNRYFERFGEPGLKVGHAPDPVQNASGTRETYPGELAANAAAAYKGSGVYLHPNVYDENKMPLYTFEVIKDDRRGGEWVKILDFHLKRILRGLLIPERALTQDTQVGSLASAKAYHAHFILMLQQIVESLVEHVNLYIIPEIISLNLGADKATARLVAPAIGSENQLLTDNLIEEVMKQDESVRGIVDWTNMLVQNNIPIIEKDEDGETEPGTEPAPGGDEEESHRTRTVQPNSEMITVNSPDGDTEVLATIEGLDKTVRGLMSQMEAEIDKRAKPVWDRILWYEDAMREEAEKFLAGAKLVDGRITTKGNERALKATIKRIDEIKDEMLAYYRSNDEEHTDAYFADFEELALEHVKRLARLYGTSLPRGYAGAVREEKLARSFGGAGRSFLENILLAGGRAAPALAGLLMLAEDQGQVVDEVAANGAMVTGASAGFVEDADDVGWANDVANEASEQGTAAGAAAVFAKAGGKATTDKDKVAAKAQGKKVSKLRFVKPADTVGAAVDDWHMNRGYLRQTIEAPARGTYRWTLATVAALAGWDVAKMYQNPRTVAEGTPSGLTEKYMDKVATLSRWDEIGRVEGVKEPLKLYGLNRGTRSYWFYMPMGWAVEQGLDIDKAGGE